ncbi:MAG: sigma 54-interacting transcriptional regulator [Silvibacterium sp.]|nr:sigma 54-interacting transcriptional regulator [Silvibacterium sp.]
MMSLDSQLKTIIDAIPILAWSMRPDGSIDYFNQQWTEYTGMPIEQALNWGWKVAKHPDDLPRIFEVFERATESGQPFEVEGRIRRRDGVFRWFLVRGNPLRDPTGAIVRWYGTDADIEDRKRAEDAVRATEQNLRLIVDNIPGFVWTMMASGEVDVVNQQMSQYLGTTAAELKEWFSFLHPDDRQYVVERWRKTVATGEPYEVEYRLRRYDGVYHWFHCAGSPLRNRDGCIDRWYKLLTDIEERKRAETELARAFEEIKRLKDRLQDENLVLREQIDRTQMFEEIVGESQALKVAVSSVARVAPTDSTVLLLGETGTGKELFARAIHEHSLRSEGPFVSVNCAAIPDSLIASELFGHEKGAFTGAVQRRLGRFELADGGTLFFDEVGDLPLDTQVKLLRVLQEREFERVGGIRPIKVDVRVIAATNRDLSRAVSEGSFRRDLFYRLNVVPIEIPTLRERRDDIPLLVHYFVDRYGRKVGKKISEIDDGSMNLLKDYSWPGNIRELQNIIERAVIVSDSPILNIDENWLSQPLLVSETNSHFEPFQKISPEMQKSIIETALRESGGRVYGPTGAARKLGIPRSTLESKIRALRIDKNRFRSEAFVDEGD